MSDPGDLLVMADQPPGVRPCSVAAALEILGERWSLLAVREISYGVHRFSRIAAYTGASRDLLADRLRKLEGAGVVERRQYSEHPPRYEYELTEAGQELRGVLTLLRAWGDKWVVESPATRFDHVCGHQVDPVLTCRQCGEPVRPGELTMRETR
jgi:DNA-binding HxlR family transcriptional regulator